MSSIKRLHRYTTLRGVDFIKSWEKLRLEVYDDGYGYKTYGYGHLVKKGETFIGTKEEAESILQRDLYKFELSVIQNIHILLTDDEFDALVSFTFNCGCGALQRSTLRQRLNRDENRRGVSQEFMKWVKSGGKVSKGLIRRRKAESKLFLGEGV